MERKQTKKILFYITFGVTLWAVLQHIGDVWGALLTILNIILPFTIGLAMAFVLNVLMRALENHALFFFDRWKSPVWKKVKRVLALLLTFVIVLGIILILLLIVVPELERSFSMLLSNLPGYMEEVRGWAIDITDRLGIENQGLKDLQINWPTVVEQIKDFFLDSDSSLVGTTIDVTSAIINGVYTTILAATFSLYVLFDKERLGAQVRRAGHALLKPKRAEKIFSVAAMADEAFTKFILGQLTEAVIIGVLCYFGMLIFGLPYAATIAIFIGVTALIPVFGAFIGTTVGVFLISMVSFPKAIGFLIFIVILQQLEGNLIYPRVVGQSVGLPGIWVLVSVTLGGSFFGIAGILLAVPVCSVLYALFRSYINKRVKEKEVEAEQAQEKEEST